MSVARSVAITCASKSYGHYAGRVARPLAGRPQSERPMYSTESATHQKIYFKYGSAPLGETI